MTQPKIHQVEVNEELLELIEQFVTDDPDQMPVAAVGMTLLSEQLEGAATVKAAAVLITQEVLSNPYTLLDPKVRSAMLVLIKAIEAKKKGTTTL
jgi:hypothetical protein